jgi:DNA ligase-1
MIVFDILPAWEFRQGVSTMNQRNRLRFLADHKNAIAATGVAEVIESRVIDLDSLVGKIELEDFSRQVVETEKLEGVMIKSMDAMYQCKRGHNWMKIKPIITVDLTVIEVEQGTGRNADRMGALVCRGTDQGREILTNVGSGFTDQQRTEIWETFKASPDAVLGQVVEIAADTLTLGQDSTIYSLRFPRWISWRGFKAGQKI